MIFNFFCSIQVKLQVDMEVAYAGVDAQVFVTQDLLDAMDATYKDKFTAFAGAVQASYASISDRADQLITLMEQTIAQQEANLGAASSATGAMAAVLQSLKSLTASVAVNAEAILSAYPSNNVDAVYEACIYLRSNNTPFQFKIYYHNTSFDAAALPYVHRLMDNSHASSGGGFSSRPHKLEPASDGAGNSGSPAGTYEGYELFTAAEEDYGLDAVKDINRARFVGTRGNRIFGGLLLHQVRFASWQAFFLSLLYTGVTVSMSWYRDYRPTASAECISKVNEVSSAFSDIRAVSQLLLRRHLNLF